VYICASLNSGCGNNTRHIEAKNWHYEDRPIRDEGDGFLVIPIYSSDKNDVLNWLLDFHAHWTEDDL
jgi:hypothetical protein